MMKTSCRASCFVTILIISLLIVSAVLPVALADKVDNAKGFDKGLSYTSVVPMKKTTFVGYDENSILDDYAYLAAVPTTVFDYNGRLFSYPLLFYQDQLKIEDEKDVSLDARSGINYFMEDWMSYCGQLDQMTLINVPKNKLDSSWSAKEYVEIKDDNPYDIASKLALQEWSYSDKAVIAVIGEDPANTDYITPIVEKGTLSSGKEIKEYTFYTQKLSKITPRSQFFEVPEGYKYLKARTWWASFWFGTPAKGGFPVNINITIPGGSPDSQFYCKYGDQWMETALSQGWNVGGMDLEKAESYIYKSGEWKLSITDIPTFKIHGRTGSIIDIIKNMVKGTTYQTDVSLYPGEDLKTEKPIIPPFGCRDATFKLKWDESDVNLGFSLIGPSGEEVLSAYDESSKGEVEMHLDQLGECPEGKSYSISVFSFDKLSKDVNYEIEYTWKQNFTKTQGDFLTSATNGAVLASTLNAPLLYVSPSSLSDSTKDALYKLGVENIYLVNLGDHLSRDIKDKIGEIAKINENYVDATKLYKAITDLTNQNCVIFSTIDPWTYWYVPAPKHAGETKAGLFIGPAAYIAAHHGSPVLIVDYHPELSSAVVWHNEYWKKYANGFTDVAVAPLYLTGTQVYNFLGELGLDKENQETMITVADGFDIGATWDRTFAGRAKPGRFFGTPVDTAYWISRDVFYPALIFNNPAMNPNGVTLTQGSYSERRNILPWGKSALKITTPSQDENFKYPVLQTYICYEHNMNAQFEKYYGFKYQSPDGIVPGETVTNEPIDQGLIPGVVGQVWPDMTASEVIPAYLEKGGYSSVFSTSFKAVTDNLNGGVLLWVSSTHGNSARSGELLSWDPEHSIPLKFLGYYKQDNPWRGYDWYLGSTANPDTMTADVHGVLAAFLGNPNIQGAFPLTEELTSSVKPIRDRLASIPILKWFMPKGWRDPTLYKDGLIIARSITMLPTTSSLLTGWSMDKALDNVYSMGWINTACLPAYKYLHLMMVRHGSSFQVIDPWATSWYSIIWLQSMPRDIILGKSVGEAYTEGISHTGILYLGDAAGNPQWWWDVEENVCLFGDPDLRAYVPDTTYSDANTWQKPDTLRYDGELNLNGHMPFGATSYPNEKTPLTLWQQYLWLIVALLVIAILVITAVVLTRKKK
jgi:hypothetical protein